MVFCFGIEIDAWPVQPEFSPGVLCCRGQAMEVNEYVVLNADLFAGIGVGHVWFGATTSLRPRGGSWAADMQRECLRYSHSCNRAPSVSSSARENTGGSASKHGGSPHAYLPLYLPTYLFHLELPTCYSSTPNTYRQAGEEREREREHLRKVTNLQCCLSS